MLKVKKLSEMIGKRVFTDSGDFFGSIEEVNLVDNRVDSWRMVVARNSPMVAMLGGARGIIVPHNFVKAVGEDVVIISKNAVPVGVREEDDIDLSSQSTEDIA